MYRTPPQPTLEAQLMRAIVFGNQTRMKELLAQGCRRLKLAVELATVMGRTEMVEYLHGEIRYRDMPAKTQALLDLSLQYPEIETSVLHERLTQLLQRAPDSTRDQLLSAYADFYRCC